MKCRLLFNEEPLVLNRLAARVLGLNEAIVVQQIHYWLTINEKAKIHMYDDKVWTYNTYEKWQSENFDFWSVRTLKRIFKSLEEKCILHKGNYNKHKYDKTMWITINYNKLEELLVNYENEKIDNNIENIEIPTECQSVTMSDSNRVPICHYGKCQNDTLLSDRLAPPIPENTKDFSKISLATQKDDTEVSVAETNITVINTNKELIEETTHLLLDSKNKINKISKWNKDRLEKAIDIFIEREGQYFTLLEKIYLDDKNFAPNKINKKDSDTLKKAYYDNSTMIIADENGESKPLDQFNPSHIDNMVEQRQNKWNK